MKENNMTPKQSQRQKGATDQGNAVNAAHSTLRKGRPASHVSYIRHFKPLSGKVFYLDLPSNQRAVELESDLKKLGGSVEKFFSKEINHLITNKREARYVRFLRQDSPIPSPVSGFSSPHPSSTPHHSGSHKDNMKSRVGAQMDTSMNSRGRSLVERVVKDQERLQVNKILSNALEWNVKILYVDDVIEYVEKKKKSLSGRCTETKASKTNAKASPAVRHGFQQCKVGYISKPFIKVEDSSRHYCPIYLTLANIPEYNLRIPPPGGPFCVEDKDPPGNRQMPHRTVGACAAEDIVQARTKMSRVKEGGGYCECCMLKYDKLKTHLQSERHKAFSQSKEYAVVDKLVSTMYCNFVHIKTKVNRPKCSTSSVVMTEPHQKSTQQLSGGVDTAVTLGEMPPSNGPADGTETCIDDYSSNIPSFRRNSGSGRSKTLHNASPLRQASLTWCNAKTEVDQRLLAKTSTSNGQPASPLAVSSNHTCAGENKAQEDNSSALRNVRIHNHLSSPDFELDERDVLVKRQNSPLHDADHEQRVLLDGVPEISERDGSSCTSNGVSQAPVLLRKVRLFKNKRRKFDIK